MNYNYQANLAKQILEHETPYIMVKESIMYQFGFGSSLSVDQVSNQLIMIDTYYSTNMSRRYYGIEEIASAILSVAETSDGLKNKFIGYSQQPKDYKEVSDLFQGLYGYNKKGDKYGQASSLISKYAFYATHFNFPIFDSIVREVYPLIMRKQRLPESNFDEFIIKMNELLKYMQVSSFESLDNLLWLTGKINRGNYSLILPKEKYLKLVKKIGGFEGLKSEDVDKRIGVYIGEHINKLTDVFSQDLIVMIKFCYQLKAD